MATFTIDLLTGNLYLFNGDFIGSGSTPTSGSTYSEVNLYSELPAAGAHSGEIYVVRTSSGAYIINRNEAGLYFSNGISWRRLGDIPSFFLSDNFQIIDENDQTKGVTFDLSGITTNIFRTLKVQDSDGTIAYLTDIGAKVDTSVFNNYTGTTAPNTFVNWTVFTGYTGTTKNLNKKIQLISTGSTDINKIIVTAINWDIISFSADTYFFSGGSGVYVNETGTYEASYHVLLKNDDTSIEHSIGGYLIKNNVETIKLTATANSLIGNLVSGELSLSSVVLSLNANDRLDLVIFRIGNDGSVHIVPNSVYLILNRLT